MKYGIQYQEELAGVELPFDYIEFPWNLAEGQSLEGGGLSGVTVQLATLTVDMMKEALLQCGMGGAEYLLISTEEVANIEALFEIIVQCREEIRQAGVKVLLENGYLFDERLGYVCGEFSEISMLKKLVLVCNNACGTDCFGIALNVGYANLLGKNLRAMVEEAGRLLELVHLNDNDGVNNDFQMPFTFTKGRGARTTDWYRLIGILIRNRYEGWLIWDAVGIFEKAPRELYSSFMNIMIVIQEEWEEEYKIIERLSQPGKKLILFGTGKMAYNYMCEWSGRYPVAFFVDNNKKLWGTQIYGIDIKAPEAILEVPEEERNVWICNRYYDEIGEQLNQMGVSYYCYNDNYYM